MNTILDQLRSTWTGMEPRRKAAMAVSVVVLLTFVFLIARIVSTPNFALLYSGLDSTAASGVVESLERQGVPYELRGDAIYVPSDQRDRVRVGLAGEGLPSAGAAGYELLDGLSGFGTTAEMFDAAYWRAKEGELARTILAFNRVIRARVHISNTQRRPFEERIEPRASVSVATTGGPLSRTQAEAIRFLVASAIGGMALTDVAVIDQEHGVILRSGETDQQGADEATTRAQELRQSVTRLLEARVGAGAAIVEVAVRTTSESERIKISSVDPESRTLISTETEESSDQSEGQASAVTVASQVADGDVEGGDQSTSQAARTRARQNFIYTTEEVERVRPAGEIEKISVAVMVDGVRSFNDDGDLVWTARSPEELGALEALVKSAVGFDEARGDVVTIQSLEFSELGAGGAVAESGLFNLISANLMPLLQLLVLGVVAALIGLFVIRPILSAPRTLDATGQEIETQALPDLSEGGLPELGDVGTAAIASDAPSALPGMGQDDGFEPMGGGDSFDFGGMSALPGGMDFGGPDFGDGGDETRAKLEAAISKNTEQAAKVIKAWLDPAEQGVSKA